MAILPPAARPDFTDWIVRTGTLRESFVVIDVGVQGGEHPRWRCLGDHLVVHGFDAIREEVERLSAEGGGARNRTYHWFAIGNEDGERDFFFRDVPTESSFFRTDGPEAQTRKTPIRKLDTLLAEGVIPQPDYLKIDVEGFEKDVLLGAGQLLAGGILAVESETNFSTSISYPKTHFALVQEVALQHGLMLFDLVFDRVPQADYMEARLRRNLPFPDPDAVGKPATCDVLFCRDLVAERTRSLYYEALPPPPSIDQIIKIMALCELRGLADIAVHVAVTFAAELGQRFDVEQSIDLLCRRRPQDMRFEALAKELTDVRNSTSWRVTAPLRAVGNALRRRR